MTPPIRGGQGRGVQSILDDASALAVSLLLLGVVVALCVAMARGE